MIHLNVRISCEEYEKKRDKRNLLSVRTGELYIKENSIKKRITINKTSKQNITRDTEIKNNLTVTRGEMGRDKGEKGEAFSGTTIKDMWTKPSWGGIRGG